MRSLSLVSAFSVALVGAVVLAACDDGPTRPTPDGGARPPTLIGLQIDGPSNVAPGESAKFTATAHYSDGAPQNIASDPGVTWRTSNSEILAISPAGIATGGERGEADITATFGGRSAVKPSVIVLPGGTYRLAGTVTDNGVGLSGVRVEVTQGPATGLVATASPEYRLYGVSGDTEIRVTKVGYVDQRRHLQVTSHARADVELILVGIRDNVEGTYGLTVTAARECSGDLPEPARVRTFTAILRQEGPRVTVVLEGSSFLSDGSGTHNSFRGTVGGDGLAFYISGDRAYGYGWPEVAEVLTSTNFFFMAGSVTTSASLRGRSGTLDGTVGVGWGYGIVASCRSRAHQFELVRR
jgi:hypothetical protein